MPPFVSILVPCYNVSKYLKQCIDSLLSQTLKDIEIICINDGSTDGTLELLRAYATQDQRIKIINKKNSGYGDSMNVGLSSAVGDYVGIVESDDFIDADMFELLYRNAREHQLEISRCCYYEFRDGKDHKIENDWVPKNLVHNPNDNTAAFWQAPAIWCSIYKRDWLIENQIKFLPTPGASYQDTSFAFKCYACCTRFYMSDKACLHYRIDSVGNSVSNPGKVFCVCDEWNEIYSFVRQDRTRHGHLFAIMPYLQYGTYRWNFNRLRGGNKVKFAMVWFKEICDHIIRGEYPLHELDSYAKRKIKKAFLKLLPLPKHE